MKKRVLILGGYGNFGKYIANTLLTHNIPIILAGRKVHLLQAQAHRLSKLHPGSLISTATLDINTNLKPYLSQVKPHVAINTCGPFQNASYGVVEDCIESGVNYIDLADGRYFVGGMAGKFNDRAVEKGVTVVTGASSVPGLSSAVLQQYSKQFKQIDKIEYGITPGQRTNRGGEATVRGVMGYIGKRIEPWGTKREPVYGWQGLYAEKYPELGYRLMGNCQVPDLDIFPGRYGIGDVRFSAGTESKMLHMGIWLTSWLIRAGLPLDLPKYSSFLLKASHLLFDPIGTDRGGMHFKISGTDLHGRRLLLKWFIIVRKGHGPNVPVVPAIVLARKMCQQGYQNIGVHPCVGLVSLGEYLGGLRDFDYECFVERQYPK